MIQLYIDFFLGFQLVVFISYIVTVAAILSHINLSKMIISLFLLHLNRII